MGGPSGGKVGLLYVDWGIKVADPMESPILDPNFFSKLLGCKRWSKEIHIYFKIGFETQHAHEILIK